MQDLYQNAVDFSSGAQKQMDHPFGDRHRLKLLHRIISEDKPLALSQRLYAETVVQFFLCIINPHCIDFRRHGEPILRGRGMVL